MGKSTGERYDMSVKVKFKNTRGTRVEVHVRRPKWQEFLHY
jgi:hypothetical protein